MLSILLLSALLTACPILLAFSAPVHQIPLTRQKSPSGEISHELFKELETLAEIVELCSGDSTKLRRNALSSDPDVVHRWDEPDIRVCVAVDDRDHRDIYVVFDGPYGYADALVDMATPLPLEAAGVYGRGSVHGGFQNRWEAVGGDVLGRVGRLRGDYGQCGLNIVGRGAGGSVAALAALNFAMRGWEPKLTTFGQPKFGDAEFMKFFDEHIPSERYRRVTHITDPVPILEFPELSLVHTNEEYFVHKPFPPYLPSDVHLCALDSEDPICSAHARTCPFDLPFTQSPYLVSEPTAAPTDIETSHDLSFEIIELEILPLPRGLCFDCSLDFEPLPTTPPASPFLSLPNPSPPSPNLNRRSLDKALEYFHLPKDQLKASLAEAAAAHEPSPAQDPNDPNYAPPDPEDLDDDDDDGKDLISQASSIIIYNGRPIEIDGKPALSRRSLLSDKSRISRRRKSGPGLGLALESTTPAYTATKSNERERHAPVNAQEKKKRKKKKVDDDKAMRLLDKRGRITYGWGEWEPQMQYLEALSGPAIMSFAREDDLDSGAWAGEAPNRLAKDRFWRDAVLSL